MLKKLQNKQVYLITGAGIGAFLLGVGFSFPQAQKTLGKWFDPSQMEVTQSGQIDQSPSAVGMTIAQSLPERSSKLREIAEKGDSPDRERARYVLASDYIQTNQGKPALELLVGLEKDYPVLAPYILLKQAQAQDMLGEKGLASDLRQRVLRDYPKKSCSGESHVSHWTTQTTGTSDRRISLPPSHLGNYPQSSARKLQST